MPWLYPTERLHLTCVTGDGLLVTTAGQVDHTPISFRSTTTFLYNSPPQWNHLCSNDFHLRVSLHQTTINQRFSSTKPVTNLLLPGPRNLLQTSTMQQFRLLPSCKLLQLPVLVWQDLYLAISISGAFTLPHKYDSSKPRQSKQRQALERREDEDLAHIQCAPTKIRA